MKIILQAFMAINLQIATANVHAAPTGSDLLTACSAAQETGFDSIQGQMCTWYVIPCNCSLDRELPEVCAPDDTEISQLADVVIEGLTKDEELLHLTATQSATIVLSKKFPCE